MLLDKLKRYWHIAAIALIVAVMVLFRLTSYGDPRLSIGTNDSSSYFDQVDVPTFSWEALTVRRLPSYVLLFKLFEPAQGYKLEAVSYPAAPTVGTREKQLQAGFDRVVLTQMWLSIAAWVFFACMVARHIKNKPVKVLAVATILTFGFLPSIAEWDSILMSESGSYSLFMIMMGFSLEIIRRILKDGQKITTPSIAWWIGWAIVFVLWAFMRDSNANTLIVPVIFFLILIAIPRVRSQIPVKIIVPITVVFFGLFLLYAVAAGQSGRWLGSWDGLYNGYVAPYNDHYQFFLDHGMPETNTREWAAENGAKTYLLMLLNFPRFTMNMFIFRMQDAFSENLQPFFYSAQTTGYRTMTALGDIFHPLSSAPFLLALIGGILVISVSITNKNKVFRVWGWMAVWILLLVYGFWGFAFFGDAAGLVRHLQGASMPMRLLIWLFPLILTDYALKKDAPLTEEK